jgi:hypothetical protein
MVVPTTLQKEDQTMQAKRTAATVLALAALAVPTAAVAKQGDSHGKGKGHSKTHAVAYVFKGTYAGEGSVEVKRGNSRVRKGGFVGETVSFDLADTRFVVADTNGDQVVDVNDVAAGDKVLVKARLPRTDPGDQPFAAQRLVDQSHPPVDETD